MPSSETAKTKSAPKRRYGWGLVVLALVVIMAVALWPRQASQVDVRLGRQTYILTRAVSRAQKEKGLSGTSSLARDAGMLFVSDRQADTCYWMKGMNYPLDIIWLNSSKKVVSIERELPANSYPKTFCHQGQYVIEINAGQAAAADLTEGQTVTF